MKTAALSLAALGGLGFVLWCCAATDPAVPPPSVDNEAGTPSAAIDSSAPPATTDAAPFTLPPAKPYDSPTCHHGAMPAKCDERWCVLPKGCFLMGTPEKEIHRSRYGEEQREVAFTHDLLISKYETTQAEWVAAGLPNASRVEPRPELISDCLESRCPVGRVSWYDGWVFANAENDRAGLEHCAEPRECTGVPGAGLFCARIEQLVPNLYECKGYRLPTRSEYEYAARGGTLTEFYSGPMTDRGEGREPHLEQIAWLTNNSGHRTHPVGQKLPNHWGLYDILGNAGEWVTEEGIGGPNPEGPLVDFRGVLNATDDSALIRGGFANAPPWGLRAGGRSLAGIRNDSSGGIGVRLVRSLPNSADAGSASDASR